MIGSSGSRIGSLRRSSHSRRIGLDGAACCCAYARCDQVAAAPPRRVENSRRFIDSPPLTSGIGELLYPTIDQDGEAIAGMVANLVAIPEAAIHKVLSAYAVIRPKPAVTARIGDY